MGGIQREDVVEMECAVGLTRVVGEQTHQPRAPLLVKITAEAGHEFHLGVEVNFVRLARAHDFEPAAEALLHVGQNVGYARQNIHGTPSMICAVWRTSS